MKRMKLYAYFARNLGDDLMVRLLLERYPQISFFCDSWKPESDLFRRYPNFENMEGLQRTHGRLNHILNLLTLCKCEDFYIRRVRQRWERQCRGAVYIGGSLYMQQASVAREEGKLENGPLFVIGANFGPNVEDFGDYFRRCGGVTFRDRASYAQFRALGNVGYAPDVVLNLKAVPEESDGSVLISVMELSDSYEKWMADLCVVCIAQGKRPVLMSFCKAEGDERAMEGILQRLEPGLRAQVGTLRYDGDMDAFLEAYRRADRVIATRFHAMILALCFEKPVFSLSYSDKVKNVMNDLHFGAHCTTFDLKSPEEVLFCCALPADLAAYKKAAQKQFAQLDRFLEEEYAKG